jgi:hypothetical protein
MVFGQQNEYAESPEERELRRDGRVNFQPAEDYHAVRKALAGIALVGCLREYHTYHCQ